MNFQKKKKKIKNNERKDCLPQVQASVDVQHSTASQDLLGTLVNVAQNDCSMEMINANTINLIKSELSSPPLKRKKSFIEDSNQDATDSEQVSEHNTSRTNNGHFEMTNLPKKPLTPYMSYRNMVFQDIKHKHPGCSPYDLACVISAKWSLLSDVERKVWEVKYEKEMKSYEKKLRLYHQKALKRKTNEDKSFSPIGDEVHELNKFDTLDYCSGCKKLKELQGFSAEINGRQVYRGDLCSKACFLEASKQLKCVDGSTYIKHSNSDPVSVNLSPFNWAEYLSETNSEPADWMYCRQASYPPSNAFSVGMKLEARRHDQIKDSNQIIFSLATVAFMIGPRLLLHFDGSSSKYDIWTLCDSWDIHPVGWTDRGSLLPPTGYRHDPKNYMQFYSLKIQKAELATARCFKKVPSMPPKNCFEVGMKLEAVDKQNPSVIGVASVVRVQDELVYIEFDGYPGLGYSSHYGDRDFFPVGWCAHAKHPLRIPGDAKNTLSNSRYSPNSSSKLSMHEIAMHAEKTTPMKPKTLNQAEVCINIECVCGPYIDVEKLRKLTPIRKGEIIHVLKGVLEDIIACAISPKTVIGFLKPGRGNCVITTVCEGTTFQCCLTVIDHVSSLWDILKQFADNLRSCPNLFSTEMYASCPRCLNKPSTAISIPLIYQRLTSNPGSYLASSFQYPKSSRFIEFEDGDIHSVMDLEKNEPLSLNQIKCNQDSRNPDKNTKKHVTWPAISQAEVFNYQPVYADTASQTESFCFTCNSLSHKCSLTDKNRLKDGGVEIESAEILSNIQAAGIDIMNRPSMWNVDDVVLFLKKTCIKEFSQVFKDHEIDGKALLLLQNEHILHHMGFKLGPAVKLLDLIEDLKVAERSFSKTKEFIDTLTP
ncbi:sex comb on midleg-like protein 2 isoform X3 [Hydra vulgaris]|uniref:sex comb on midleg-like protein 2 isoform X3 n=2 Tax=Hydra vulgaris TaxID=6087 RepID=UPI001F5F0A21|nr:sex comb on midleg-like protein 2 isoform X2 [Hydra vulgaris]